MIKNKVHNVRFYNIKCKPIYCMAIHTKNKLLAVSRSNASVEIWNLQHAGFIERTIPSIPSNYSIEGLTWFKERLFSVGLHGFLIEYDLLNLGIKNKWALTGQSAFCIDSCASTKQLAVGTEMGYINIYSLVDEDVVFYKFVDKQEGRIMCLKYDPSGSLLIGGGEDAIRIWNVKTGHAIHKMTTGRSVKNVPTIVWCLCVTDDLTVISGDSRGKITFWDGKIGGQLEAYQSHKSDIFAICLSDDKKRFYCAGIDPKIASYELCTVTADKPKWIVSMKRNIHDHDVRALVTLGDKLFSAGEDGYLNCSYFPPKTLLQFPPILQGNSVMVAKDERFILLRYSDYLELWTLCRNECIDSSNMAVDRPKKLLVLQRNAKNNLDQNCKEGIICADISNNGKWIAFSTDSSLRLFTFSYNRDEKSKPIIQPLEFISEQCGPCVNIKFTSTSSQLILSNRKKSLVFVNLLGISPSVNQTIDLSKYLDDTCTFLKISDRDQYLIAADCKSNISVWKLSSDSWIFHCKLAKYSAPITAISFHFIPRQNRVFIGYADHKIVEYNISNVKLISSTNYSTNKKFWNNKLVLIRNICFDPNNEDAVILHDDSHIAVFKKNVSDMEDDIPSHKKKKKSKQEDEENDENDKSLKLFKVISLYKHLIYFDSVINNELIAVEVTPDLMKEELPESFKAQSAFGRR